MCSVLTGGSENKSFREKEKTERGMYANDKANAS